MLYDMWYKLDQMKLNSAKLPANADEVLSSILPDRLNIAPGDLRSVQILSRSLDARRGTPSLLYTLLLDLAHAPGPTHEKIRAIDEDERRKLLDADLALPDAPTHFQSPIVVGTGPCGIFAALALAMAGCRPVVIDRGFAIEKRDVDYAEFLRSRKLDPESNLLIGEGGAGAYSDGKLYTGTRDNRAAFILKAFAEAGAPDEIRYLKRPHIGSDFLGTVAVSLRKKIVELGGTFLFGTAVTDLLCSNGRCCGVITASGEKLTAPAVLIATGLGGRELNRALRAHNLNYLLKGFQLGSRIEHPQALIDRQQYHMERRPVSLGAAEYHMVSRPQAGALPVSTFCMCPGGETVMASAWEGRVVSNGMSCHARAGEFANSALIVTVPPERFGNADEAFALLEQLERGAFELGGSDYTFPAQDAAAFLRGEKLLKNRRGSAALGFTAARLDQLFLPEMYGGISSALRHFDRQCPGFIREGKLVGIESCVSSPVRFLRDQETLASSMPGLWLGGEGAGCAGGIMSAAADGLKLACAMIEAAK